MKITCRNILVSFQITVTGPKCVEISNLMWPFASIWFQNAGGNAMLYLGLSTNHKKFDHKSPCHPIRNGQIP